MTLSVDVLDPRRDPEPPDWAGFRESEELPVPWDYGLLTLESESSRSPNLLALVRDGGRIVAAFGITVCGPGPDRGPRRVGGPARLTPRWAEVHHPWLSGYPGWSFTEALDAPARRDVVRAFERAVCRYIGIGCLGVMYRSVPPEDRGIVAGRGRIDREAVSTAVLDNTFETRDQWISSLTRSRRHSIRGQIRKIAADPTLTIRCETERDDLDGGELARMALAHRAKFGSVPFDFRSPVSAEYLHALVRRPDVVTMTYHDDTGRLLAFTNILDHPVLPLHQHWATVPVEEGGRKHLYFDVFARVVGHMIDGNRKAISAGRGLADVKASLGFTPRPLRVVISPRPVCG